MKAVAVGENHLYQKAYAKGKKAVGRYTVVYVMKDLKASKQKRAHPMKVNINRVGLTVTKRIGGAVVRNRVKRILREGYRLCEKELPLRRGRIVIIVARDAARGAKSTQIYAEMRKQFESIGMLMSPDEASQRKASEAEEKSEIKSE
ncbi:MAG: ribonuclease P protein component [Clostridia bacterium]|nr:ribonuclease P protein component [Clostridia bacterium]